MNISTRKILAASLAVAIVAAPNLAHAGLCSGLLDCMRDNFWTIIFVLALCALLGAGLYFLPYLLVTAAEGLAEFEFGEAALAAVEAEAAAMEAAVGAEEAAAIAAEAAAGASEFAAAGEAGAAAGAASAGNSVVSVGTAAAVAAGSAGAGATGLGALVETGEPPPAETTSPNSSTPEVPDTPVSGAGSSSHPGGGGAEVEPARPEPFRDPDTDVRITHSIDGTETTVQFTVGDKIPRQDMENMIDTVPGMHRGHAVPPNLGAEDPAGLTPESISANLSADARMDNFVRNVYDARPPDTDLNVEVAVERDPETGYLRSKTYSLEYTPAGQEPGSGTHLGTFGYDVRPDGTYRPRVDDAGALGSGTVEQLFSDQ